MSRQVHIELSGSTMCEGVPAAGHALLVLAKNLKVGALTLRMPTGKTSLFRGQAAGCEAELHILDWRACTKILYAGDIGFAEAYGNGWLDSPDLTTVIKLALQNEVAFKTAVSGSWLGRIWHSLLHRLRRNSKAGSRRNIHAHYDLGNEFYALWLDPSWTYSSAWFQGDYMKPLNVAQEYKYQRIFDKLNLQPGMRVLEIGCGWGGFALHAAARGVEVHGVTISKAQLEGAQQRVRAAGLESLIKLEFRDYRDLEGEYDAVVSIEMFEAVGEAYWQGYFDAVRSRLKKHGHAMIQSITVDERRFDAYRHSSDFIREYIFPGGMLPSPTAFTDQAAAQGMLAVDAFAFGRDYAETLRRWRADFECKLDQVRQLGFDEKFIRLWRLYYQYCEAGFDAGSIDVYQFHLQRAW